MDRKMRLLIVVVIVIVSLGGSMVNAEEQQNIFTIPGKFLGAWNVCYPAFMKIEDMTNEEKKLEHYRVEFSEDKKSYIVFLIPNLLSEKERKLHHSMVIGRTTKYWIDKRSLTITQRFFYKA